MRLLIVGSMSTPLANASKMAIAKGASVQHAEDTIEALKILRRDGADMVMIDVALDIKSVVSACKKERISVEIVACGVKSDSAAAVKAIKAGAKEYIPLPPDAELIAAILETVTDNSGNLLYADEAMAGVVAMADKIAPSEATVLITGESGTGKEMMARRLHDKSKRQNGPFISVNCAAIPENLLESELFGHEKGAFTGAVSMRAGKFEQANGGTLLLDEISEMDVKLQAKLLRAIQEREIDRVGGTKPVKVDIRLLATSNRNLMEYVRAGNFREDLYYRLNVVGIKIPPLRDRPKDIAKLSYHFAEKYCAVNGLEQKSITSEAIEKLQNHSWPGNVRELENTMHRAVLLAPKDIIDADAVMLLDQSTVDSNTQIGDQNGEYADDHAGLLARTMATVERDVILGTMDRCLGDNSHAAAILGISIKSLQKRLQEYDKRQKRQS